MIDRAILLALAVGLAGVSCESVPTRVPPVSPSGAAAPSADPPAESPDGFQLVGHEPLGARGMNSGLAIHDRYAYVGSRTDGSHRGSEVLVVDIPDPSSPRTVGRIGPPHAAGLGTSTRELRVWPARHLLIVLSIPCEPARHGCAHSSARATVRFFDVAGERGRNPAHVVTYEPSVTPHEMFLWTDPTREGRALLYLSTNRAGPATTSLIVADIADARRGIVREVLAWSGGRAAAHLSDARLHSLSVSRDGARAYLAYERAGVVVLDTSRLAAGRSRPTVELAATNRRLWPPPGAHSATEVPGRDLVVVTEEVYGGRLACPWGVMRLADVSNPARPTLMGRLGLRENDHDFCPRAPAGSYTYSTHNPTPVGDDLVLVSWHAGGLRAVSIRDPARPTEMASFVPNPLPSVLLEDPELTTGPVRVAVWSYPIVREGLVYVVDVRNGLYVLSLSAIAAVSWAEGSSSVGLA